MEEVGGKLACDLKDLTPATAGESAQVQGEFAGSATGVVLGASEEEGPETEDGAYVYFVAKGVLTSEPNAEGHTPASEQDNLYIDHYETAAKTWKTTFIATLSSNDAHDLSLIHI